MVTSGVLGQVFDTADAKALPILIHLEALYELPADAKRRLAVLTPSNAADVLRLDKATTRYLNQIIPVAQVDQVGSAQGYRLGYDAALDAALLRAAWTETPPPPNLKEQLKHGASAVFPIKAQDLMDRYAGKALGDALKTLETRWIASDFSLTKDQLLA
jgi:poly(A) polymerase